MKRNRLSMVVTTTLLVFFVLGVTAGDNVNSVSAESASELEWRKTVDLLFSGSRQLQIEHYATGKKTLVDRTNPSFDEILGFLKPSSLKKATEKTVVQGTTTVFVTIPYPWGYFLTFELNDGSKLRFDLCTDENGGAVIWFESESTIYEVQVSSDLVKLVEELLTGVTAADNVNSVSTTTTVIPPPSAIPFIGVPEILLAMLLGLFVVLFARRSRRSGAPLGR